MSALFTRARGTNNTVLALKMVGQMIHVFFEDQRPFLSDKLSNGEEVCALRHDDSARIFDCFLGREALEISISDHFFRQKIALGPIERDEAEILKHGFGVGGGRVGSGGISIGGICAISGR